MFRHHRLLLGVLTAALLVAGLSAGSAGGYAVDEKAYVITLDGDYAVQDGYAVGSDYAVYAVAQQYAVYAVQAAGGTVISDMSKDIGVIYAVSSNTNFAELLSQYAVIDAVSQDIAYAVDNSYAVASGGGGPSTQVDPLESPQWGMQLIRAPEARKMQAGWRAVDVGILDTGIDGQHVDFQDDGLPGGSSNVDCARGHNSVPAGPAITGTPDPCIDNGFHGTHVAGIVAAQANGTGVVGVAPNVTLVPVKVCDQNFCYAGAAIDGIDYAADAQLDVINMSFFVDDWELAMSTECKPYSDPSQKAIIEGIRRAIAYARKQGVTPVAALGNSKIDLGTTKDCDVVPAETPGVVGISALGPKSELASYSSYGSGAVDVAAPGGNGNTGDPTTTILSSVPANGWASFKGTSMASPHAAGVAALIESQYGALGAGGDVKLSPSVVESRLQSSAFDIGKSGYDAYFGYGRIDALRAVGGK